MANVARIWLAPEETLGLVTIHKCWVADNFHETATFDTRDEAIAFCRKRWGSQSRPVATYEVTAGDPLSGTLIP